MANIITPRPPLNLFESIRSEIDEDWRSIYDVPFYTVPAEGPQPERQIGAAAIMTGLLFTPIGGEGVRVSARVLSETDVPYPLIDNALAPAGEFLSVVLDRQVLLSGERLQVKTETGTTAVVHFSFILNQREEFQVLS